MFRQDQSYTVALCVMTCSLQSILLSEFRNTPLRKQPILNFKKHAQKSPPSVCEYFLQSRMHTGLGAVVLVPCTRTGVLPWQCTVVTIRTSLLPIFLTHNAFLLHNVLLLPFLVFAQAAAQRCLFVFFANGAVCHCASESEALKYWDDGIIIIEVEVATLVEQLVGRQCGIGCTNYQDSLFLVILLALLNWIPELHQNSGLWD